MCDFKRSYRDRCPNRDVRRVEVDARGGGAYYQYGCGEHLADLAAELEALPTGFGIAWIREGSESVPVFGWPDER